MTRAEFKALLERRARLEREHDGACAILEEEGPGEVNYRRCVRRYDELVAVQAQIDAELQAERDAEERAS